MATRPSDWINPFHIARRIRVKSILMSSYRRRAGAWDTWLRWETTKSLAPLLVVAIVSAGMTPPLWLGIGMGAWALGWTSLVLVNAISAVTKLNRRRDAYLKAMGYDPDLSVMADADAWQASLSGRPTREYIKAYLQKWASG